MTCYEVRLKGKGDERTSYSQNGYCDKKYKTFAINDAQTFNLCDRELLFHLDIKLLFHFELIDSADR